VECWDARDSGKAQGRALGSKPKEPGFTLNVHENELLS